MAVTDWLTHLEPAIAAAIVAAVVGIATSLLTSLVAPYVKYRFDRSIEARRVDIAFRSEQQKKLHDHIALHKGRLLETAESLSNRLWNHYDNNDRGWLSQKGSNLGNYSMSFAYRILCCRSITHQAETQALYIDAAVARPDDFYFLKSLKMHRRIWTETGLFDGLTYDRNVQTDHFFRVTISLMLEHIVNDDDELALLS